MIFLRSRRCLHIIEGYTIFGNQDWPNSSEASYILCPCKGQTHSNHWSFCQRRDDFKYSKKRIWIPRIFGLPCYLSTYMLRPPSGASTIQCGIIKIKQTFDGHVPHGFDLSQQSEYKLTCRQKIRYNCLFLVLWYIAFGESLPWMNWREKAKKEASAMLGNCHGFLTRIEIVPW